MTRIMPEPEGMSLVQPFEPSLYERSRPQYPAWVFEDLLTAVHSSTPLDVLDLGAGTGHAWRSWHSAGGLLSSLELVEPLKPMLQEAEHQARQLMPDLPLTLTQQRIEHYSGPKSPVDLILIGSAIHWMSDWLLSPQLNRIASWLKPGGALWIGEYQFPKLPEHAAANEWIRRSFNLRWKAPDQKPRGRFEEIISPLTALPIWLPPNSTPLPRVRTRIWPTPLTAKELEHLIRSQSRYQHWELSLDPQTRETEIANWTRELSLSLAPDTGIPAEFKMSWFSARIAGPS